MPTPEQLHIALNHVPFLGAALALILLLIGYSKRHKTTVLSGLIIAMVSGWTTPFIMHSGESAYERYYDGPVAPYLDQQASKYLEIHEQRAHEWSKLLYASALIYTLAFCILLWKTELIFPVTLLAAGFCIISFGSGIWIAESGGPIRRPDFRNHSIKIREPEVISHTPTEISNCEPEIT